MKDFLKGLGATLLDVLKSMSIGLVMAVINAIKAYFAKAPVDAAKVEEKAADENAEQK